MNNCCKLVPPVSLHAVQTFVCSNTFKAPWCGFSHLVILQEEGLYGRKWVEQELRKHLNTIGRQIQDLEGWRASKKRKIRTQKELEVSRFFLM